MGYLVLQGGSEFGGQMRVSDLRAMALAGGRDAKICIVPAAAAPDGNHNRAGQNGQCWFESLGARHVSVLPLIDRLSADSPAIESLVKGSNLIYLLGGFPGYLAMVLQGSRSWEAMCAAHAGGAVIAGSSAGAMVLAEHIYDPAGGNVIKGLGLLPGICVIPHFNTFGRAWVDRLQKELPSASLMGIDEETGTINDGDDGAWSVYGPGNVRIYRHGRHQAYVNGRPFDLPG